MLLRQYLEPISKVRGFIGVGVFTPEGEQLDEVVVPGFTGNGALLGNSTNELLLSAQEITKMLGFEIAKTVEIDTEKGVLLSRCFNDNMGKHFHIVAMIEAGGNVAMGRILLEQAANNAAKEF